MKLSLRVTRHTTASELVHLGNFFTALGLNRGAAVFAAPTDPAELDEGDVVHIPATPEQEAAIDAATGITPKRRRRTKAEIEAAQAAAPGTTVETTEPVAPSDAEVEAAAKVEVEKIIDAGEHLGNEQPAPTQTAPVTDTASATQAPAAPAPATASPSEPTGPVTHAEAQRQAIDAARRHGPEKVKAVIAQYEGASKIADLKEEDLTGFIAKLQALAA